VRPNLDSQVHLPVAAAVLKVHQDAADSVADLAVAWVLVVVAVKSTSPTFVPSSPFFLGSLWA
jgi:hypothetical protein